MWQEYLDQAIESRGDSLIKLRRHLHQYPETSGQEFQTTAYLVDLLKDMGCACHVPADKRGIVADIGSVPLPRMALRADLDALQIQDEKSVAYRSQHTGVMHACGHDGHAAMLLGAAAVLKRREAEIKGTIRLIWQPAEEGGAGGKRMVEEGVLSMEPKPQAAFGFHQWPFLPLGSIGGRPGPMLAATELFDIVVSGVGGHAAM